VIHDGGDELELLVRPLIFDESHLMVIWCRAVGVAAVTGGAVMATFVLVHGGGHGGWCWQRLSPLLRADGHEVYAPTLTGLGERAHLISPEVDLDMHIEDVVAVLKFEDLRDVILVGHSYGGMVITGVADRAPTRVGQLVYLDTAAPSDGRSLADMIPDMMAMTRTMSKTVDGVELVLNYMPEAGRFYGVQDEEALKWMEGRLTPQPWRTFEQPLRLIDEEAVKRIPRTDIICSTPMITSIDQEERTKGADRVFKIDSGHDLMITEPEQVAEYLLQLTSP
jgi:pimeloyl-ACP methyl ester carboxylesterase